MEGTLDQEEGPFSKIPLHDVFVDVLHLLTIPEIAKTRCVSFPAVLTQRQVSTNWWRHGKECVTVYEIGLNKDGTQCSNFSYKQVGVNGTVTAIRHTVGE